jgi:hypothetical protein
LVQSKAKSFHLLNDLRLCCLLTADQEILALMHSLDFIFTNNFV